MDNECPGPHTLWVTSYEAINKIYRSVYKGDDLDYDHKAWPDHPAVNHSASRVFSINTTFLRALTSHNIKKISYFNVEFLMN